MAKFSRVVIHAYWPDQREVSGGADDARRPLVQQAASRVPAEPIRVLIVEPFLLENGGVRVMLELAHRWDLDGTNHATVFVVQRRTEGRLAELPDDVDVTYGSRRAMRFLRLLPVGLGRMTAEARRHDVVLSGSEIGIGLLTGYLAARIARRPFVVAVHAEVESALRTWVPPYLWPLSRHLLVRADHLICVADHLRPTLVTLGAHPTRISVVANGIDVEAIRQAAAEPSSFPLPADPVIVAAGRLAREKGHDTLIRAHAAALASGARHHLVILGEGPLRGELEQLAHDLGVADTVHLPGFVTNPHAVIARSTLYCLTSRSEGMPLGLLEAMAMGTPVLTTDCGIGAREAVGSGAFGTVVAVDDVPGIAKALALHLESPSDFAAMASDAMAHAASFELTTMSTGYAEVLGRVVAR